MSLPFSGPLYLLPLTIIVFSSPKVFLQYIVSLSYQDHITSCLRHSEREEDGGGIYERHLLDAVHDWEERAVMVMSGRSVMMGRDTQGLSLPNYMCIYGCLTFVHIHTYRPTRWMGAEPDDVRLFKKGLKSRKLYVMIVIQNIFNFIAVLVSPVSLFPASNPLFARMPSGVHERGNGRLYTQSPLMGSKQG